MKISVITVCRNASKTIEQSLLSLYNQTYKNIEHIVIDGASTDGTLEILSKYKDNISVLVSEPDTGIYNAMNKGLKLATGDIIYFLNATDCIYDENILEKVVKEFKNYPDLELLWGDVLFVEDGKNVRVAKFENIKSKTDLIFNNPCHQVIFYKNNVFKKFGNYNEKFLIYADYDFNVRALVVNNAKCEYLSQIIARFELGGISTSPDSQIKILQKQERIEIYNEHFSNNFHYKLDNFFTKIFGTPTRFVKKTKCWEKIFITYNAILQTLFNKNLSLNHVK